MRTATWGFLALAPLLLSGCDTRPATEPVAAGPAFGVADVGNLSPRDQAALDALNNGTPVGATIDTEVGCGLLPGFFNETGLVAFGGLFPNECTPGTFDRTNPDETVDIYHSGRGLFFLLVFRPSFRVFGSEGSDVQWRTSRLADGRSLLVINGTLSNGSRVLGHFVRDPSGADNSRDGTLWVEGLGYVVAPGQCGTAIGCRDD